jgi:hypothetical protein
MTTARRLYAGCRGLTAAAAHIARVVRNKGRKVDFKQRSGSHG